MPEPIVPGGDVRQALTSAYARYTPPVREQLTSIALALAGRAGARLAEVLGLHVAKDTLLRLVRAAPEEPVGQIRVLGVLRGAALA
ncbi:hypothetical protein NGF19_27710 [Streptomyces sp. RY43-2]|uniref:Uncharacterized protein n=1 Tax=Streptomyces macrolidinus TaxID=2952607 RepID=A0ABT0ZLQ2_9ACTN|nr:hypothetical protein [Streptomyces macrolidinus]MCN9244525.1 hypothetical protein [Streptomyces macrolidinus]